MARIPDEALKRIAEEEAKKLKIELTAEDSIHLLVTPDATEDEAREKIREILKARTRQ